MTDLVFNIAEIESLSDKISALQPRLTPAESALLLAIFAVAANQAKRHGTEGLQGTLPTSIADVPPANPAAGEQGAIENFKQQLLNSYIPGESFKSIVPAGEGGRIGGRLIPARGSSAASGKPGSAGGAPAPAARPEDG